MRRLTTAAVVAATAGVVAMFIPRSARRVHAPTLDSVGAAGPLPEPAYAEERF